MGLDMGLEYPILFWYIRFRLDIEKMKINIRLFSDEIKKMGSIRFKWSTNSKPIQLSSLCKGCDFEKNGRKLPKKRLE